MTGDGQHPLLDQNSNCSTIEVTDVEVENSVRSIPKLDTLILVKVLLSAPNTSLIPEYLGHGEEAFICQPFPKLQEETAGEGWQV